MHPPSSHICNADASIPLANRWFRPSIMPSQTTGCLNIFAEFKMAKIMQEFPVSFQVFTLLGKVQWKKTKPRLLFRIYRLYIDSPFSDTFQKDYGIILGSKVVCANSKLFSVLKTMLGFILKNLSCQSEYVPNNSHIIG